MDNVIKMPNQVGPWSGEIVYQDNRFVGLLLDVLSLLTMADEYTGDGYPEEVHERHRKLLWRAAMWESMNLFECAGSLCYDNLDKDRQSYVLEKCHPTEKIAAFVRNYFQKSLDDKHPAYIEATSLILFRNTLAHPRAIDHRFAHVKLDPDGKSIIIKRFEDGVFNRSYHVSKRFEHVPVCSIPVSPLLWGRQDIIKVLNTMGDFLRYSLRDTAGMNGTEVYKLLGDTFECQNTGSQRGNNTFCVPILEAEQRGVTLDFMIPESW